MKNSSFIDGLLILLSDNSVVVYFLGHPVDWPTRKEPKTETDRERDNG